ncbi:MAG: chromosome segregation protein SMC [Nanoarchaeota archaeon]
MTRILKLVLHGFKSFAKRTEIVFDETFNVVLGPNGSGKSNVLDSLCFVLGRTSSKSMRAEKLENLIYNGGKLKKPAERCEVSILFSNKNKEFPLPEEVVKVSRFVKKTGTSVYKINDKRATRQEIVDLLSSARIDYDGYNIILQGDIVHFVEMPSEERRMLIEEVAGISVYEEKKNKALGELGRVDERLREADILLTERKTHLKELKDDRDQALKYKEVTDKLKAQKATLVHLQLEKKEQIYQQNLKQSENEKGDIQKNITDIETLKTKAGQKKGEIAAINEEIEKKGEKEQVKMHKEIENAKVQLATNKHRLESCEKELTKLGTRETQLQKDQTELGEKTEQFDQQKKDLEKERQLKKKESQRIEASIATFREKHKLEDLVHLEQQIETFDKDIDTKQAELQGLVEQKQNMLREQDRLDIQVRGIDEKIDKISQLEKESLDELESIKKKRTEFKKLILDLNLLISQDSGFAAQIGSIKKDITKSEETLSKLRARAIGLRERLGGSNRAVRAILENKSKFKGVIGTVIELGKVESKYSLALDIAAGPRALSIVVEDDEVAATCIRYLKTNKLGTATFLPLNKIKGRKDEELPATIIKTAGVFGKALELVKFDPRYSTVFSHVFGSTIVVDNIETARKIGIGKARMVTLDGDLAEISGAMVGGYQARKGESLGFQEEDTSKEMSIAEGKLSLLETQLEDTEKIKSKNEEKIAQLRTQKAEMEGEILKAEKSLSLEASDTEVSKKQKKEMQTQFDEVSKKLRSVELTVSGQSSALAALKTKRQMVRNEIGQLRSPTMLAELNAFEQKKTDLITDLARIELEIKNVELQSKTIHEQETGRMSEIIKLIQKERAQFDLEAKDLTSKIESDEKMLVEMEKAAAEFYKRYKNLFNDREKAHAELQKIETSTIRKEEEIRSTEQRTNLISLRLAELSGQIAGLKAEFEQFSGVQILTEKTEEQLKDAIYRAERNLTEMGNVNLKALEVYDSVEAQYNELMSKKDTLMREKNDVLSMIAEIEDRKKELFMNSFNIVNEQFKKTFQSLSTKGEASLVIENPENPFLAGVRIMVNLTGTKFLDIRSLSGGEKTLTALAFIFSIQEHEPASFYVFDEVDAALDKKNSAKLAQLIKKYSSKAQYIVISHNDSIIQEASTLYGVSMDESGTSNVVSLRV